jgi:hypothetical protein
MATDNVTPIRPGTGSIDTPVDQFELAQNLMVQAVRAAILLIAECEEPGLASDVLRLARDRYDSACQVRS